ncbi:MAG TPA: lysozyme [Gemmatimonadales bacterium]|nr:lysozyme [Gemmatimonadales bacterium]
MPTSRLLEAQHVWEGCRLEPYLDQLGLPTIGRGHRIPSLDHPPITQEEADRLFLEDVRAAEKKAIALAPNLTKYPRRLDALTDLVFNGGSRSLEGKDIHDPSDDAGVVKALRAEDWKDAAARFRNYCHGHLPDGTVVKLEALVHRRNVGARWIEEG